MQDLRYPSVIASVKDIKSIFTVAHFLAFFNFEYLDEEQEQVFFAEFQKQAHKSVSAQLGKRKIPLTYIFNCKTLSGKIPHLFVNKDIFADREKLRLTFLQEIKAIEVNKPSEPVSKRLTRILWMCCDLLREGCLPRDNCISRRRFYQDVGIIKNLIPDVKYDRTQDKYITQYLVSHLPDKEETRNSLNAADIPVRMKRVLLIYQQLLYDGWITRDVADALCTPVSLRMFQRDIAVIESHVSQRIIYDMEQQKYVLTPPGQEPSSPAKIRIRNEYRRA